MLTCLTLPRARERGIPSVAGVWPFCSGSLSGNLHTITIATLSVQQHREKKEKNNNPHLQSLTVSQRSRRRWLSKNGISACPSHVRGWPCGVLLAEREAKMAVDRRRQQQSLPDPPTPAACLPPTPRFPRTVGTQHTAQSTFRAVVLLLKKKKKHRKREEVNQRAELRKPQRRYHQTKMLRYTC